MVIKLFEEYSDKYYQKISELEFNNGNINTIKMDDKDITRLKSLFDDKEIWVLSLEIENPYTWIQQSTREYFYSRYQINIFRCKDEWYYIEWKDKREKSIGEFIKIVSDSTYYKCDQFEGLIQLLKDKGLIR